jgi:hypothetical protein
VRDGMQPPRVLRPLPPKGVLSPFGTAVQD